MHASLFSTVSCTQVLSYMQVYCIVHASTKSYRIMQTSTTSFDNYHSGDLYDHYVAPNQLVEDEFDYDQEHSENQEEYHAEDSFQQDSLMYENHDAGDITGKEEPFEDDPQ